MRAFDNIVTALSASGMRVRHSPGGARAQCPAHDGHDLNLSVRDLHGRASVRCFVGCDDTAVLAAIGLSIKDLFDESGKAQRSRPRPRVEDVSAWDLAMDELQQRWDREHPRNKIGRWKAPSIEHVCDRIMQAQARGEALWQQTEDPE